MVHQRETLFTRPATCEAPSPEPLPLIENSTAAVLWRCSFPGCMFTTNFKPNLKKHGRRHDTDPNVRRPFPCTFENCDYRATVKWVLKEHMNVRHTPTRAKTFKCPMCPSIFYTKGNLREHIPTHVKEKRFQCSQCEFSTHTKICLTRHVRGIHEKSVAFTCSVPGCNYSTTYANAAQKHRNTHEPDPNVRCPFPCSFAPDCSFRASYRKDLKRHIAARHTQNRTKEAICPLCSKAFYRETQVRGHIAQVHAKDQTFSCDKCSFKTYYANGLKLHRWIEHGDGKAREKKFKCDHCDFRSHSRSPLEVHRRTVHTSERRFRCDYPDCSYKTNAWHALKKHMLTHEKDPKKKFPIKCNFPGCDFRRRYGKEMKNHQQNHEMSRRRLKCEFCPIPTVYPDKVSLKFHTELVHHKIPQHNSYPATLDRPHSWMLLRQAASQRILTVRLSKINVEIM